MVDPKACITPGTPLAIFLGYFVALGAAVLITVFTYGIGLILFILSPLWRHFEYKKSLALIHGSGIKINEAQFPEIYDCVKTFATRLNLKEVPEVYIIEASVMNAAAIRLGRKQVITLTDDLIHGCLLSKRPEALAFVIGHELGHIALGHNKPFRGFMNQHYKKLSRLDEYTADCIGHKLVQSTEITAHGIIMLTVGPQLLSFLNYPELMNQVDEVLKNKYSKKAERGRSHPLLLHRMQRILQSSS